MTDRLARGVNRRTFLTVAGVSAAAGLLAACGAPAAPAGAPAAPAAPAVNPTAAPATGGGASLTVLIHPTLYAASGDKDGLITRFGKDNNVTIDVVTAQTADIRTKILVEGAARSGRLDTYVVQDVWMNDQLTPYLEPLDSYLSTADASYGKDDFIGSLVKAYQVPRGNGAQYAVPFRTGTAMFYYRKDLLQQAGITPPTNWDEFATAAEKLTTNGVFGVAEDLAPTGNTLLRIQYAHGAKFLSDDGASCIINSPEGVAGLALVAKMYQSGWMDKEALTWERDPVIASLQQGRAAMTINYSPYWGRLIDPAGGPGASQMAWSVVPTAPGVPKGRTIDDGWGWAIDKNSKNKQTAWALAQYMTNAASQLDMALHFANGPTRSSVYQAADYGSQFPLSKDWLVATAASDFLPPHPKWPNMLEIYNGEATTACQGKKTAKQALDDAQARITPLLK
ncbi:MAG TPA: extracellular solute-binding protein [Chloroflexota bacterium]|jgi:multiple sugar transport system substrate-binding protein|nr:extracellular solute-binding protein [Chloroflexota bacterium]